MPIAVFNMLMIDCLQCIIILPPVSAKKNVMEEFPKLDSKLRVIFCISAFGLGVNIPDIDMIINWGAPTSVKKCMQEFMRGRRDGRSSSSSSNPENCPFWVNI